MFLFNLNLLRFIFTIVLVLLLILYIFLNIEKYFYISTWFVKNKIESIIYLSKISKDWISKYSKMISNKDLNSGDSKKNLSFDEDLIWLKDEKKEQTEYKKIKYDKKVQNKILLLAEQYKNKWQFDLYEKKLIEWISICPWQSIFEKKLAKYYTYINNNKKAIPLLKKAIENDNMDHEAIWQLWEIYISQWEFDNAEIFIKKSINIAKDRPKYYISLVEINYNKQDMESAIANMKKAIQLRPNNVNYILTIAKLYESIWDLKIAKRHYFDVLEIEPSNLDAKKKINTL